MGKINVHIANAGKYFTQTELGIIQSATKSAQEYISDVFDFDYDVDLMIVTPSFLMNTIPEDGISGRTYHSQLIAVTLNKQQADITEDTLFETICHEMSHSLRWQKLPEYSRTLFDAMILEGLAVVLEEQALISTNRQSKQFFLQEMQRTSKEGIETMIAILKDDFSSEQYDYETIFYTGNDTLPRWAGYKLGYYFAKKNIEDKQTTIPEATLLSYSKFSS
jgi:uncharacterized protein YjaZ